jgi:outer membrane immunogenic protein
MRTLLAAVALLATTGLALPADLPALQYFTVAEPLSAYSWAGPYVGFNAGYEWARVSHNPTRPSGFAGGVEAGFNFQQRQFVFGDEADLQLSGASDTFAPWQFSNPWFGTVRGRAGISVGNALLFGTAGIAFGGLTAQSPGMTQTRTGIGWVGGAGIELGLSPQWSAKAEWLYLDLSDRSFAATGGNNGLASNLLRLGINYRF